MLSMILHSNAPWNETYFKNADFDKKLEAARGELDQTKRKALYHELYGTLVDQGWTIPLAWSPLQVAYNKRVQGLDFANILGTFYWENVSVQ